MLIDVTGRVQQFTALFPMLVRCLAIFLFVAMALFNEESTHIKLYRCVERNLFFTFSLLPLSFTRYYLTELLSSNRKV
ncbi:hypothetical protein T4D_12810 [Trichinella pseudospiralis]|uniref:Uncharacterized protein n=1 Tax=Trichinella pseudospiralis TaxID=6337 RepID=A0A0V1FIL7_TRIPS|nr:hypothetical protein T4D_12810 [Trichinella pseudospiralis]